jgi:hypothetical protein
MIYILQDYIDKTLTVQVLWPPGKEAQRLVEVMILP